MQKRKLSEVIAQALLDAQVSVCTHVPGYGGTETFEAYRKLLGKKIPCSFHEEVAYTLSHGAGLVGNRSACLIKTHGFAKATNSIISSLSAGTLGGVVLFAFDDEDGSHSDNIFKAEGFIQGSEIPYDRLKLENPYEQILRSYEKSESIGLPVALIVNTSQIHKECKFERREIDWKPRPFKSQPELNVVCPPMSRFQREIFEAKISGNLEWNKISSPTPLQVPQGLPSPLKETALSYVPIFDAFKSVIQGSNENSVSVSGDAGTSSLFAFSPYHCIDFCTYMGGSTSLAVGAFLAGFRKTWAVTGDFSFISAGHLGLLEAFHQKIPIKLLILNNKKASATGNQEIDPRLLEAVLKPYEKYVISINAFGNAKDSFDKIRQAFVTAHESSSLAIVVAEV